MHTLVFVYFETDARRRYRGLVMEDIPRLPSMPLSYRILMPMLPKAYPGTCGFSYRGRKDYLRLLGFRTNATKDYPLVRLEFDAEATERNLRTSRFCFLVCMTRSTRPPEK